MNLYRAFYFFHFFAVGVHLPYLNLYFRWAGLSGGEMGLLNAAQRLAAALAPPFWGALADRRRRAREVMAGATAAGTLVFAALALSGRSAWILPGVLAFAALWSPIAALGDNATLRRLQERGRGEYGRVRLWGSAGFIVAALFVGRLIEGWDARAIFPAFAAAGAALLAVVLRFPAGTGGDRVSLAPHLRALLAQRPFFLFLLAGVLLSASAGAYGVFFTVYLDELGVPGRLIGLAWAAGVMSEIAFLAGAEAIRRRLGPEAMIASGMAAAALRWELTALTVSPIALVAIQLLHGISFGVFHAGAVAFVDGCAPAAAKNTAQTLYGAVSFGLGGGLGSLLAGAIFDAAGMVPLLHGSALGALAAALLFWIGARRGGMGRCPGGGGPL